MHPPSGAGNEPTPAGAGAAGVPADLRTDAYDYDLPTERIAQFPAEPRDASRLLVVDRGRRLLRHARFRDLAGFLEPGDTVAVNESRVFPARLLGETQQGGKVEVLLVEPLDPVTAEDPLESRGWTAMLGSARGARPGFEAFLPDGWRVVVEEALPDGLRRVRLEGHGPVAGFLGRRGHVPLPPYIHRPDAPADREAYQTVYAGPAGSVAAPTAGLHFTDASLGALEERGIDVVRLVLHVGPGTFRPVRDRDVREHDLPPERFSVPEETARKLAAARERGGRVVCVGTTTVRALESAARGTGGAVAAGAGATRLFIHPPFDFLVTGALVTNFHLPRSTLLMLVSAFAGRELVLEAYREAVRRGYRFYSYGDAMLIV